MRGRHFISPYQNKSIMKNKILVVDDDPSIILAIETLLQLEGFDVQVANNGANGLEKYKQFQPNLVLVDIMMPVTKGHDMVREIRMQANGFETKVIYLTAKGMEIDKKEGYAIGADDYIVKPYSNEELLETLRLHLT